jgi:hypothetical protein
MRTRTTPRPEGAWSFTDLRPYCRESKTAETTVDIFEWIDDRQQHPWLKLGQVQLEPSESRNRPRVWTLKAFLDRNATDQEHDSAQILRLPLIGVELQMIAYQRILLYAYIDPSIEDDDRFGHFRVPRPDYNPFPKDHEVCTSCDKKHPIVQYLPPFDKQLYQSVRGKAVEIAIGPVTRG